MKERYIDDAATTQVKPAVLKAMLPFFTEDYGNPSSPYALGEMARDAVNESRKKLAKEINSKPQEIIFTSGVTEANNLALQGMARASKKKKIVVSAIEHASIIETCDFLRKGYEIAKIPVNKEGLLNLRKLEDEIDGNTLLVSVMHANNVIGTIQDIYAIGALCRKKSVLFHTDAAQSFGKLAIDVKAMNIDLLSAGAHKIGGPKGIGFLYAREGIKIEPLIFGGGQERGMRGGTENVPAIVGFARALELQRKINKDKIRKLKDNLIIELEKIGGTINGSKLCRLYNNIHVCFSGIDADSLVAFLSERGIYVSTGSACETRRQKEDHVLKAIGLNGKKIKGSIRITLNEDINQRESEGVVREIMRALKILR